MRDRFKVLFNIKQVLQIFSLLTSFEVVNPLREAINEIYSVPDGIVDDADSPLNGFLVEIKCLYSGKLPNRPIQEHYVQSQAHMQSNDNERTLLIYWSPTGFTVYLVYRNAKVCVFLLGFPFLCLGLGPDMDSGSVPARLHREEQPGEGCGQFYRLQEGVVAQ